MSSEMEDLCLLAQGFLDCIHGRIVIKRGNEPRNALGRLRNACALTIKVQRRILIAFGIGEQDNHPERVIADGREAAGGLP